MIIPCKVQYLLVQDGQRYVEEWFDSLRRVVALFAHDCVDELAAKDPVGYGVLRHALPVRLDLCSRHGVDLLRVDLC